MAKERIEAKVAKILTARELVLNRGDEDGVEVGMRFAILNSNGREIKDPDTGEVIGSVELPKTFVKVIATEPKLAVARTFREFVTPARRSALEPLLWSDLLQGSPEKVEIETLKTDESKLKEELDPSESYVKIGDPAVQVVGDEYVGLG